MHLSIVQGFRALSVRVHARNALAIGRLSARRETGGLSKRCLSQSNDDWVAGKTRLLENDQRTAADEILPWFKNTMPNSYFRHNSEDTVNTHLRAFCALKVTKENHTPSLTLIGDDTVTFIRHEDKPGVLTSFIKQIIKNQVSNHPDPIQALKSFAASDGSVRMDMFGFSRIPFTGTTPAEKKNVDRILDYCAKLQAGVYKGVAGHPEPSDMFTPENLAKYFKLCSADYIAISDPRRFCEQRDMYEKVRGTDEVIITTDEGNEWGDDAMMVTVAATNMLPEHILVGMTQQLASFGISIKRAHVDVLIDGKRGNLDYKNNPNDVVVMTRFLLNKISNLPTFPCGSQYTMEHVLAGLRHVKWVDPFVIHLFQTHMMALGKDCLMTAELISCLINASRGPLSKIDRYAFVGPRLQDLVINQLPVAVKIAQLFLSRFDPANPLDEDEFLRQAAELKLYIHQKAFDSHTTTTLEYFVDFVTHVQATNMFNDGRYALSMKLDPAIMHQTDKEDRPIPHGVYYVHGRRFDGFHVRFRDIARGGLRMVTPTSRAYEAESCRHYDENYALATAQQLKNKDIPEGGSKAVVLIRPSATVKPEILTRKCVKAFNDGLLDLIGGDDVQDMIVRRDGVKDILYLGPDEQIIPEDIAWMTERAKKRMYFNGNAYISSKASNGINHKEFGVTSEGVNVFMEVALKRVKNIDPKKQPFTVKLTGGPDGDVAGNMMKIMNREYGDNVKVVAIADGLGGAEDPDGLDMDELLRLFKLGQSIVHYNPDLVNGVTSFVHNAKTAKGAAARNSMHNRVEADVFVPGGGRPDTIGEGNYKAFLKADGTPSSSLVVEGANLFLTPAARTKLFECGTFVVKDSSANKCGVVVSSYEIVSAMLMDEKEFVDNKKDIVRDVQAKIKELARLEAELLFDEYERDPKQQLPNLSLRISNAIIKVSDAVYDAIEDSDYTEFNDVLRDHLPETIAEIAFDRMHDRVPRTYIRNIISKRLGTTLVYNEGLAFAESNEGPSLARIAIRYGSAKRDIEELVAEADSTDPEIEMQWKQKMIELLKNGSPRLLLETSKK